MRVEDVETIAKMVALDHNSDPDKGFKEAKEHTTDHLKIVPEHCYVVENEDRDVIGVMVLHPRKDVFEIEDFHVKEIQKNKDALFLMKKRLMQYLEKVQTEVLCCPFALKRLMMS
jgi:hypothetical protein